MSSKLNQPLIPLDRIDQLVQIEPALVILGLAAGAFLGYKALLRDVSKQRHDNLRNLFRNVWMHIGLGAIFFGGFVALVKLAAENPENTTIERLAAYVGLLTLLSGLVVFVKVCRILVFEYLFLSHMQVAVPLLLVNLCTLLLSIVLGVWVITEIFAIRIVPVLATSAAFSIVLGLALQDTLGNLFAGVALQLDKPYEIGDWIEIQNGTQKWVGQVQEISWRATILLGLSDESVTVPNRTMAAAQIANFSARFRPIVRSQIFRLPYGTSYEPVRAALTHAALASPGVRKDPTPFTMVTESTESWMTVKVVYSIDDYGSQHLIADRVISSSLLALERQGIRLAAPRLQILKGNGAA